MGGTLARGVCETALPEGGDVAPNGETIAEAVAQDISPVIARHTEASVTNGAFE
jgi:hypothetical protein